ncbi:MAG: 3-hydroxyacyl-CoA dehydrogenase NAD-binding domain-containing protein [Bdellovibrio bacteriovorus]
MNDHWQSRLDPATDILWLGLDQKGRSINLLSAPVLDALETRLDEIQPSPPRALAIHSLKTSGFLAGADLGELAGIQDQESAARQIRRVHALLDRIESLPCPTLALIHGVCLGGGLELALACRYRIAADDPETRLGFPEVRLGIFPGYGGTYRAIRALGPLPALALMLQGRALTAREALRIGLVDRIAPRRQLERAAAELLARAPPPVRATLDQRLLNAPALRPILAAVLEHRTARKVIRDHYPAPFALIEHWRAHGANRRRLLDSEARSVPALLRSETARNLLRVFQLQERLKGLAEPRIPPPRRVHVIGAGTMGGDIAAWCALNGFWVTLEDVSQEQLGRALGRAQTLFRDRLREPRRVQAAADRLIPDPKGEGARSAELVIEAIVEDREAKARLFQRLEGRAPAGALLATNTSSIPLEQIGAGLSDPSRLIGLHFFNPVARMQLVEVVRGKATDPGALARGLSVVRALDRLPLPVQSRPGFLVNRVLMPYLLEAMDLLEEGVPAALIDGAAVRFGMPMGPLALADSVGLEICLAVAEGLGRCLTAPEEAPARLRRMVEAGLTGRKGGRGFYRYRRGRPLPEPVPRGARAPEDLAERLIFRLLNESVACLREGVVADPDLLDAGVIFGTGFAPHRGGPLHYIDQGGWERMGERLQTLERRHGGHFRPDRGWRRLARA